LAGTKFAEVIFAITYASAVLPVPGGPKKIRLVIRSALSIRQRSFPAPMNSSCPTNSSRFRGRIRAANGAAAAKCFCSVSANKSMIDFILLVLRFQTSAITVSERWLQSIVVFESNDQEKIPTFAVKQAILGCKSKEKYS